MLLIKAWYDEFWTNIVLRQAAAIVNFLYFLMLPSLTTDYIKDWSSAELIKRIKDLTSHFICWCERLQWAQPGAPFHLSTQYTVQCSTNGHSRGTLCCDVWTLRQPASLCGKIPAKVSSVPLRVATNYRFKLRVQRGDSGDWNLGDGDRSWSDPATH